MILLSPFLLLFLLCSTAWAGDFFECTNATGQRYATDRPCKPGYTQKRVMMGRSNSSAPRQVVIPLVTAQRRGSHWVDATLNGVVRVRFLIDTGASSLLIPADVLQKLTAQGTVQSDDHMGEASATIADGSVVQMPRIHLRSFELGSAGINDVVANVGKAGVTPLLSMSVVERIGAWRIDQEQNQLVLDIAAGSSGKAEKKPQEQAVTGTPECVLLQKRMANNKTGLDEIRNSHIREGEKLQEEFNTVKNHKKDINDAKKGINMQSLSGIRDWNNRVEGWNKELQHALDMQAKYEKNTAHRKSQFSEQVEDTKKIVDQFNKKCSGTLFQKSDGGWGEFPEFKIGETPR